jgi:threonine/homoserine/homoserine lactone efflux protein
MDAASLPAVIVSAFVVSFVTVVVPSPITVAAGHYAMARGTRAAGAFLGAVTLLDGGVFAVLALGVHPILRDIGGTRYVVPAAGFVLVAAGVAMVVVTLRRSLDRMVSLRWQQKAQREESLHGPFLAGLAVASANPGYWLWWTTAGTAFIHAARHWGRIGLTLLLVAFLGGVILWYATLLFALHRGRHLFTAGQQRTLMLILGSAVALFGVYVVWRSLAGGPPLG